MTAACCSTAVLYTGLKQTLFNQLISNTRCCLAPATVTTAGVLAGTRGSLVCLAVNKSGARLGRLWTLSKCPTGNGLSMDQIKASQ